jgi:anti-sigma regulatory factor (Ser/Thr protein kinase)
MDTCGTELPPTRTAPQLVRRWLRRKLRAWHVDDARDVTELLATELVSNVVDHVGEPMRVRVYRWDRSIRVEVDDPNPSQPSLHRSEATDERHRGMFLVDTLASRWGAVSHADDGKTVWFEVDVVTAGHQRHAAEAFAT